jgi:hypothetical protein
MKHSIFLLVLLLPGSLLGQSGVGLPAAPVPARTLVAMGLPKAESFEEPSAGGDEPQLVVDESSGVVSITLREAERLAHHGESFGGACGWAGYARDACG